MKIISASSNPELGKGICEILKTTPAQTQFSCFADHEIFVQVKDPLRGEDVFIIQSTSYPANDNLMELLITVDAVKRASAKSITAVIPYFGYARQDRKTGPRTPISAKLVADMMTVAGVDRVVTVDLHSAPIQGYFNIPVDNLYASPLFVDYIKQYFPLDKVKIVSPDIGGVRRARELARRLGIEMVIVDKYRPSAGKAEALNLIGDIKNYYAILIDDIIDSGQTLIKSANLLKQKGALSVTAFATHGVLSDHAVKNIETSVIEQVFITNTIAPSEEILQSSKISLINVDGLLAETIKRINSNESLSNLF